jgi:predicted DCC family thiol-disulfide oxidoreductase YuxK
MLREMRPAVILYDSDCGFCRWAVSKILAWDRHRRLRPVALQSAEGKELLPQMSDGERMASWHLVTPDDRVYSAGRAAPPLLRLLPGGKALAAIAAASPRTIERLYRWISDHREPLARLVGAKACAIDPEALEPRDGRSA